MTEEQRELCQGLIRLPPKGKPTIENEEFVRRFPSALEDGKVASRLLEEAARAREAQDLSCAMVVGAIFGFGPQHIDVLIRLLEDDWHHSHEDMVSALDELRTRKAVGAFFHATQWVPQSLQYDDFRALAVKAIWALGNLNDPEAESKLQLLADSENAILRNAAMKQLERHRTS